MFRFPNRSNSKTGRTSLAVHRLETRDVPSVVFPATDRATDARQLDSQPALVAPVNSATLDRRTDGARPATVTDQAIGTAVIDSVLLVPNNQNSATLERGMLGARPSNLIDTSVALGMNQIVDPVLVAPVNSATLDRVTFATRSKTDADRITLVDDQTLSGQIDADSITGMRTRLTRR
jgi:hypothetical protein